MRIIILISTSLLLVACTESVLEPAGIAITRETISDADLERLPCNVSLAEIEQRFGLPEPQPGPRFTYKTSDHTGDYFWMYFFTPQEYRKIQNTEILLHHIVRADSIEENGLVVWPKRLTGHPVSVATGELNTLYLGAKEKNKPNKSLHPTHSSCAAKVSPWF